MRSAAQIIGILLLIGGAGALRTFRMEHPDFDFLDDHFARGELMGVLLGSAFAVGLIVWGFQKGRKKAPDTTVTRGGSGT